MSGLYVLKARRGVAALIDSSKAGGQNGEGAGVVWEALWEGDACIPLMEHARTSRVL